MIIVARIVGEGFNLTDGQETPKSLVLSNGAREIVVQVDDEVINEVIKMSVEASQLVHDGPPGDPESYAGPTIVGPDADVPHIEEPALPTPAGGVLAQQEDDVIRSMSGQEEGGAGDEYDDPSTGVASI